MVKHSRVKLMRRKKKLFPWLRIFYSKYSEKFFNAENTDIFEYLFLNVEKEIGDIYLESNEERRKVNEEKSEDFFNILNSLFLHFWWQMRWKSCKKWKNYWKKVETTEVSTNDSHRKCCIQLLHYMILLSIVLTGGNEQSDWIGRILTAIKSLPDAVDILCSALLLTSDLKKKHISVYSIILKHTLCCETAKNTTESKTYCKVILLFRRLLKLTECQREKSQILRFTSKLKVPSDIQNWLSSQNIEDSKNLDYDNNLTQELLSRSYPDELLRKLSEILTEDSFCKRKSLKVDNIDAYNVPSNVTSIENFNAELDEDMESFDKTNSQISLSGIRTTTSCVAAKNLSSGVNDRIKNTDLNKQIINPVEEMFVKTNFNRCSESFQKNSKNPKLENVEIERDCPKTKKSKSLKESSVIHKNNEKKSKEKSDINAEFETYSKLSGPALTINECPSNVSSKENISGNLVNELDKGFKESLDKTNLQNGMVAIRTTTSCMTAENSSNDVNNSIKDKNLNKEVLIPNEEMSSETNINHCSESLQNASKNQKHEKEESVKDSHKKKKAKTSKEPSKKSKKHKKKSKEKPDITALKINDGVETCSKLSASALDIDGYPSNVTSNENISGNLNCELNKGLSKSLDITNLQNGLNAIRTTTCITAKNPSNDVKSSMKDKNINKEVLNAIEGMSGETSVSHCSESLLKKSKKQLGKEENVKDSHKKKKAKTSKEPSKKSKKHKKKSKEKPDITALKINHEFETHSKVSVPGLDIDECPTNVSSKNVSGNINSVLDDGRLDSLDKAGMQNSMNSVKITTSFATAENLSNDANKRIKHLNVEVLNPFEGMSGETNSPKSVKQTFKNQIENEASERSKNKKEKNDKVSKIHKKNQKISIKKLDETSVEVIERLEPNSKLGVDINVSSNVSLDENISKDLNRELNVDLLESVVQNDLNDINNMIKDKDLHNTVSNPMDRKCNEINVTCCSESLKKASKKRKLENKKSERLSHKKKKKEKRLKESVKKHKKNKKKSKEKTDKTTLKKEEKFDTKLNIPASDNDIPFMSSLKKNVSEDLLEALLESNASNTQNDFNGVKTTTSCIAAERTSYDINGLDIDKDLYDLLSNSMEGIFDKSLEKASKKQKCKNEESERRNHKKKKKDKILKQSSEDCNKNKKKSEEKPDKNKEFEPPCNSQKRKKSKKAEKAVTEISKSSKQQNCNLNSGRNRSKSTSSIEELHDFESALDQEEVFHEQPDCNMKTKRRSKSESEKKEQNHSKKSKKLSRDKKITKHNRITEFDLTGAILPVKNFSESENVFPQIKNQSQSKKVKKHFREKLQMPNECLNISGVDNSDTIFSVNNFSNPENIQHDNSIIESYGKKTKEKDKLKDISEEKKSSNSVSENNYNELFLMKENTFNKPKKSPKVKRKKLFKDSHCLANSHKEIQSSTTITNNCTVPAELSPSKRHSFLDDDASGNINMSSINSNIDSNFSSSEEATTFSDVSVSDILNFPVDIYRHNAALGLSPKTKNKKKPNLNINEQNREFSLLNNDLLMASRKILQQSISEPFKSQSCIDNESGAKGTEKDDNQNAGMLSFCSTNISESDVDSDFVGGNKVPKKCASAAVLTSKQSNEVKSLSIFQQSQFMDNTEDTFLSMDCSFRQDFEADCTPPGTDTNLEMSVSHELTSENIAKANELYKKTKGAVTGLFCTDKQCNSPCMQNVSTIPIVNSNHNTESSDFQSPSTNSTVNEIHQELSEFQSPSLIQVANSNVSSNEPELLATSVSLSQFNVSVTKSQTDDCGTNTENVNCKSVSTATESSDFQSPSTGSTVSEIHQKFSEFQSPSLIQVANSNVSSNEPELLNTSVSLSQFNVSVTKSQTDDCGTNTENVNCKSVSTATESSDFQSPSTGSTVSEIHQKFSEFQSPSLIQVANSNVSSNEPELLNTSVSLSQFNVSVTKSQTDGCGMNTENVNCKSVSTATDIINSNNSVNSYSNHINSNDISNQVSSIQVTVNFTGNDDCSASRKQQFVAHFGFQTINNFERTPQVSSVSFSPANVSTPRINNSLNLDSMGNHDPLHIIQFNQSTNSIEKSVNCNKCCDTNTSHKPEKIRQCVALNDSDLNQTLFSNSSPTIVNKSKNINQCHPKLFSNFASLYGGKEALSHSSICKNESLLSQDKCLKPLTNENLDSPIGESNELSLKAKDIHDINNDSSYRTSTIYLDESGDDCSHISSSSYSDFQTVGSMDVQTETLKVGALSETECLLSQDGDFEPLTTQNLDSLNRGAKVMNNDSSHRSSTIYSSDSSLSTLSNYSYNKREVSIEETSKIEPSSKRKRSNKIPKNGKRIETYSDSSMPKLEPIMIDKSKSCSEEDSLSEASFDERDTLKKKFSPVNNRKNKSRNSSKENNSLSKSYSDKGDDPKKNLPPVNNLPPLTPRRGKARPRRTVIVPQESSLQQKIIPQNKVPLTPRRDKGRARKTAIIPQETSSHQEIITQNKGYNLRSKNSLQTPKSLLDIEIDPLLK